MSDLSVFVGPTIELWAMRRINRHIKSVKAEGKDCPNKVVTVIICLLATLWLAGALAVLDSYDPFETLNIAHGYTDRERRMAHRKAMQKMYKLSNNGNKDLSAYYDVINGANKEISPESFPLYFWAYVNLVLGLGVLVMIARLATVQIAASRNVSNEQSVVLNLSASSVLVDYALEDHFFHRHNPLITYIAHRLHLTRAAAIYRIFFKRQDEISFLEPPSTN